MRYGGALAVAALLAVFLAACDDPNSGVFDPQIRQDTVDLAVPAVAPEIPSALDVSYASSPIRGRYPELAADAESWDVTIRRGEGTLLFAPAGLYEFQNPVGGATTAAITAPIERTIDELRQAPSEGAFIRDSMIPVRTGVVYVVRSRATGASYGGCQNYAKVEPLAVDVAGGTVQLRVVGNARCNDRRLVEED